MKPLKKRIKGEELREKDNTEHSLQKGTEMTKNERDNKYKDS